MSTEGFMKTSSGSYAMSRPSQIGSYVTLCLMVYYAYVPDILGLGSWRVHSASVVIIFLGLSIAVRSGIPKVAWPVIVMGVFIIAHSFAVKQEMAAVLHSGVNFFVIAAYLVIFRRFPIDSERVMTLFLTLVALPMFFYWVLSGSLQLSVIFPTPGNAFLASITPPGGTLHFTSIIGGLCYVTGFAYYLSGWRSWKSTLLMLIGGYFAVFGGSQAVWIGIVVALFLGGINYTKIRVILSFLLLLISVIFVFSIPYIVKYSQIDFQSVELRIDTRNITSSRDWIWERHMRLFSSSPLIGNREHDVRGFEIGDIVDGERARARSESFYTIVLAWYGIVGILFHVVHCYLFYLALKSRSWTGVLIIGFMIITGLNAGGLGGVYSWYFSFSLASLASCTLERSSRLRRKG